MTSSVVVDSSVWIEAFRDSASTVVPPLEGLLNSGHAVITGLILAEILYGCRNDPERATVKEAFDGTLFLPTERIHWEEAGDLGAALRRKGVTLPLSDLVIASVAIRANASVFTLDSHFSRIPRLKLFTPSSSA